MSTAAHYVETKPGGRKYYKQLLQLQDDLFLRAMREAEDNGKAAACARAWEVLEERKRIMRGRPLPGSLRPAPTRGKKAARQPSNDPFLGAQPAPLDTKAPGVSSANMAASPAPSTITPAPVDAMPAPADAASARLDPPASAPGDATPGPQ